MYGETGALMRRVTVGEEGYGPYGVMASERKEARAPQVWSLDPHPLWTLDSGNRSPAINSLVIALEIKCNALGLSDVSVAAAPSYSSRVSSSSSLSLKPSLHSHIYPSLFPSLSPSIPATLVVAGRQRQTTASHLSSSHQRHSFIPKYNGQLHPFLRPRRLCPMSITGP